MKSEAEFCEKLSQFTHYLEDKLAEFEKEKSREINARKLKLLENQKHLAKFPIPEVKMPWRWTETSLEPSRAGFVAGGRYECMEDYYHLPHEYYNRCGSYTPLMAYAKTYDCQSLEFSFDGDVKKFPVFEAFVCKDDKSFIKNPSEKLKAFFQKFETTLAEQCSLRVQEKKQESCPIYSHSLPNLDSMQDPICLESRDPTLPNLPLYFNQVPNLSIPRAVLQAEAFGLGKVHYYYRINTDSSFSVDVSFKDAHQEYPLFCFTKSMNALPNDEHGKEAKPMLIWCGGKYAAIGKEKTGQVRSLYGGSRHEVFESAMFFKPFPWPDEYPAFADSFWKGNIMWYDGIPTEKRQASIDDVASLVHVQKNKWQEEFYQQLKSETQKPDGPLTNLKQILAESHQPLSSCLALPSSTATFQHSSLYWAVALGHIDLIKFLFAQKRDVNIKDHEGRSLLHLALLDGYPLLRHFCMPKDERYPIHAILKLLLENHADANATNAQGVSVLQCAINAGDLQSIELLINHGANVNALTWQGYPLLNQVILDSSVLKNAYFIVKLLSSFVDVNLKDVKGNTPFRLSFMKIKTGYQIHENYEIAKILLDKGANVNEQNAAGETLLHWAILQRKHEMVEELLAHYKATTIPKSPFKLALATNDPLLIKIVVKYNLSEAQALLKSTLAVNNETNNKLAVTLYSCGVDSPDDKDDVATTLAQRNVKIFRVRQESTRLTEEYTELKHHIDLKRSQAATAQLVTKTTNDIQKLFLESAEDIGVITQTQRSLAQTVEEGRTTQAQMKEMLGNLANGCQALCHELAEQKRVQRLLMDGQKASNLRFFQPPISQSLPSSSTQRLAITATDDERQTPSEMISIKRETLDALIQRLDKLETRVEQLEKEREMKSNASKDTVNQP